MSFAGEVKKEILSGSPTAISRLRAQAYGMLLFGRNFGTSSISLQTENKAVADLYVQNLFDLVELHSGVTTIYHSKKQGGIFVVSVDDEDAIIMSRLLAGKLGIGVGISSGANFIGAVMAQEKLGEDSTIVTVFADDNKKYLSTDYSDPYTIKDHHFVKDIELTGFIAHPAIR